MEAPILFRFVMAIAILPWFIGLAARLREARDYAPLAAAFYALVAADVATVLERSLGIEFMDVVQHAFYALAGTLSVVGVFLVRRGVLRRRAAT